MFLNVKLSFVEHILDEAKVLLAVSYIKGIPVPEEIKVSHWSSVKYDIIEL